jgi:CO dehydrogenase maturation factor
VLLIVSNGLPVSLQAAFRIGELSKRLALRIGGQYLVLNDVDLADVDRLQAQVQRTGLELLGVVPSDSRLRQLSREGETLTKLAPDSAARRALRDILEAALSPTAAAL